jgi:DNA-binding LacI/PurR family transcriptional regulator
LLLRLRRFGAPVSVWWEHSPDVFPRFAGPGPKVLGFDISFGKSSGIAVGRHLRSMGEGPVAFISPFHGGTWSRMRLEGMREAMRGSGLALDVFVDGTRGSAWEYHQAAGSVARGERRIRDTLRSLLKRLDPARHPVWVAVNDHTAVIVLGLLRGQGKARPRLVSFDNSSASDAHQFDSFEFHTEGMVRQMLYHVLHPEAPLFKGGGLHEMVGRLVLRT